MTDKKYQVFISSTFKDLEEERSDIIKAILELYHIPIGMEMFSAEDEEQWEIIRRTIDISDYYILILGFRYGSETSEGISFTQKEYEYAIERKIPILALLLKDDVPLTNTQRDNDLTKINNFREIVLSNSKMADFWSNKDELSRKVSTALMKQIMQKPAIGWIRGNQAISKEFSEELSQLSKENRELRALVEELKSKTTQRLPKIELIINDINVDDKFNNFKQEASLKLSLSEIKSLQDLPEHLRKFITEQEIKEYHSKISDQTLIDKYYKQCELFYKAKNYSTKFIVNINNNGTTKATNIHIKLKIPDDLLVIESIIEPDSEIEMSNNPLPIKPETLAQSRYENNLNSFKTSGFFDYNKNLNEQSKYFDNIKIKPLNGTWSTKLEKNRFQISIDSLVHTLSKRIDDGYLIIPLRVGNFEIEASIICEEYEVLDAQIIQLIVNQI